MFRFRSHRTRFWLLGVFEIPLCSFVIFGPRTPYPFTGLASDEEFYDVVHDLRRDLASVERYQIYMRRLTVAICVNSQNNS